MFRPDDLESDLHDLVIRNGWVLDGTGSPGIRADIAVDGDRISEISVERLTGRSHVDAGDRVVCPGFIDLHSHADFTLPADPDAISQITQGVTTVLTGNCGSSPFPIRDEELLRGRMAKFNPDLRWNWSDVDSYRANLRRDGLALNVALQVGLSALRLAAMGDEERAPTAGELAAMVGTIHECAAMGVYGLSSGLIYAPGAFAAPEEVQTLAAAAHAAGLLYSTHMRNESDRLLDAVREALEVAERTGVRLEISHLKAMGPGNHGSVRAALAEIESARARGVDVTVDVYPYTASNTNLTSRLPNWSMSGGEEALVRRLGDPGDRGRIADALRARFGRDVDPEGVVIAQVRPGPYSSYRGLSIAEIGRREGTDPADAALRVLERHEGWASIINHAMDPHDVETVLAAPFVSVASDSWLMRPQPGAAVHPRNVGTFTRVLGHYVRERGVLELSDAVRKMTGLPAMRMGLADRGFLRVGAIADLVVFDPETVRDNGTYEDPWQLSTGVGDVFVSGVAVLHDGNPTGERPGRALRRNAGPGRS